MPCRALSSEALLRNGDNRACLAHLANYISASLSAFGDESKPALCGRGREIIVAAGRYIGRRRRGRHRQSHSGEPFVPRTGVAPAGFGPCI